MDWLGPFLAAVATGVFLFIQQWRADKREDRRRDADALQREKDRQHALDVAAQERRFAVSDSWREDRRAAHAEAFEALDEYRRRFSVPIGGQLTGPLSDGRITQELLQARARSREAVSVVKLIGGPESATHATQAHTKLIELQAAIGLAGTSLDGGYELLNEAGDEIELYVAHARRELETNT